MSEVFTESPFRCQEPTSQKGSRVKTRSSTFQLGKQSNAACTASRTETPLNKSEFISSFYFPEIWSKWPKDEAACPRPKQQGDSHAPLSTQNQGALLPPPSHRRSLFDGRQVTLGPHFNISTYQAVFKWFSSFSSKCVLTQVKHEQKTGAWKSLPLQH